MILPVSDKALTEFTFHKKKKAQQDVAVNTRHEIKTPTDSVAANINYFFESKIMEIESNPRRIYFSGNNIFSEDDIIQKFVTLNDSTIAVTNLSTMTDFNITELLLVETSIIKAFLGTYNLPNVTFNSSLFKANTSYIVIIDNEYLKVINSFAELNLSGVESISLYESGYKLYELNITSPRLRVKNSPLSIVDNNFILYDTTDGSIFKYFPYFFKEMINEQVFIVQNISDIDFTSDLDFYFQVMGHENYSNVEEDIRINKVNPNEILLSEYDEDALFALENSHTFNPNEKLVSPKIQPAYSKAFKLIKVTELNGTFAFYYVHKFTPNSLFFYEGLLIDNYRIANCFPGNLNGTEFITTELDSNVAIFPLTYQLNKLVCLESNSLTPLGFEYEDHGDGYEYYLNDNNPTYQGAIQIYHSHKEYAYRRHIIQDLLKLNDNPDDAVEFSLGDVYLTEKGMKLITTTEESNAISFYCKSFMNNEYLFINIKDNHAVIKSPFYMMDDLTSYQISSLLDRGIFLLPESYGILFINGRMIDPQNVIRLFGNYCTVDPTFFNKKIHNISAYVIKNEPEVITSKLLTGLYINTFFYDNLQTLVDNSLSQYFLNLYSVKEDDTEYLNNMNEEIEPYESYKGKYDRLAHFLSSKITKTFLDSPINAENQEIFKSMVKKAFSDLSVEELDIDTVNGDKIVIFTGNNTSRYNAHK